MEGIKEAIAYIAGLAVKAEKPETIEINGRTYCTKDLRRYDAADKAEPIKATTLTSLVDYIKESREELRDRMIIQVVSATKVLLYSDCWPNVTVRLCSRSTPCCRSLSMAASMIRRASSWLCSHASRKQTTAKPSPLWRAIS